MKEMGEVQKGKSETGGVLSGMIGGGATGVGLSERGTEGAGICFTFNWKLMLPNT